MLIQAAFDEAHASTLLAKKGSKEPPTIRIGGADPVYFSSSQSFVAL